MPIMSVVHKSLWQTPLTWVKAWSGAILVHGVLAWGVVSYTQNITTPPKPISNFEIIELPSSSMAKNQEEAPEDVATKEPEPEPEPKPEPEPEPEPIPKAEPVVKTKQEPKPLPKLKPIPKPKPKPKAKLDPKPKPRPTPKPMTASFKDQNETAVATATAYAPPSQHAVYIKNPKPAYPTMARKRGMEGKVILRVAVHANGTVKAVTIETSTGYALLDRAARMAVLRWRFAPAKRGGVAVDGEVLVPFEFRLTSG